MTYSQQSESVPTSVDHWHAQASSSDISRFSTQLKDWEQEYDQVEAGEFSGTLKDIALNDVRLFREQMSVAVAQYVHMPEGLVNVLVPVKVSPQVGQDHSRALVADAITLLPQNQDMYFIGSGQTDYAVISVEEDGLLNQLCAADQSSMLDARRNYSLMVSPDYLGLLRQRLPLLLDQQLDLASRLSAEQMREHDKALQSELMDIVVQLYTGYDGFGHEIDYRPLSRQHQNLVRRSHEFALSEEGSEASILDVCKALNIPRRTLNYAFQRATGMSAVRYLRSVKLNNARRDILKDQDGIGDIAARYGFYHGGYFGQEYRKLFGETPTATRESGILVGLS
ncbi:MAG: hypothetical protein CMH98_18235 [Oceanospirillaceae bacterium]|nr:hypothetical protein [Oceanospirillaceae bacterium]|tara:strand:- start:44126 stop:45142 length:1017 start_codon:yes stop_codon:yes gene_type:complete